VDPSAQIGRYTLVERLGASDLCEVHLALSVDANGVSRPVVLKIATGGDNKAIQHEARLLAPLKNEAYCELVLAELKLPRNYIVLEFVDGVSVEDILTSQMTRSPNLALTLNLGCQLAQALHFLHTPREIARDEHGAIIHGDINPGNLIVTFAGTLKVLNFGSARVLKSAGRSDLEVGAATLRYTSPSRFNDRQADLRDDIFALGLILWEFSTCKRYWGEMSDEQVTEGLKSFRAKDPAIENSQVLKQLRDLIMACLAVDYFSGYSETSEVARDLENVRKALPVSELHLQNFLTEGFPIAKKRAEARQERMASVDAQLNIRQRLTSR